LTLRARAIFARVAEDLELWSNDRFSSPWVLAVWVALKEKGLAFSVKTVSLERGEHRQGDYGRFTLTAKVPALRHGDFWLSESQAIIEYLDEAFGPATLLPGDARRRARDRQLMQWIRTDFGALREAMPFQGIFGQTPARTSPSPEVQAQAARLLAVGSEFISGRSNHTAADFDLAFMVRRLIHYGFELAGHPDLVAHCQSIWSRPSVQAFVAVQR
jgi:glutathione S-transferase